MKEEKGQAHPRAIRPHWDPNEWIPKHHQKGYMLQKSHEKVLFWHAPLKSQSHCTNITMQREKTTWGVIVRRTEGNDMTHFQRHAGRDKSTHIFICDQRKDWWSSAFVVNPPSPPSPCFFAYYLSKLGGYEWNYQLTFLTLCSHRIKIPQRNTFIRPFTVVTFRDLCPFCGINMANAR